MIKLFGMFLTFVATGSFMFTASNSSVFGLEKYIQIQVVTTISPLEGPIGVKNPTLIVSGYPKIIHGDINGRVLLPLPNCPFSQKLIIWCEGSGYFLPSVKIIGSEIESDSISLVSQAIDAVLSPIGSGNLSEFREVSISGKILDSETIYPIKDVQVKLLRSSLFDTTDANGTFQLTYNENAENKESRYLLIMGDTTKYLPKIVALSNTNNKLSFYLEKRNLKFSMKLTDFWGNPVFNDSVTFKINQNVYRGLTDSSGNVSFQFPRPFCNKEEAIVEATGFGRWVGEIDFTNESSLNLDDYIIKSFETVKLSLVMLDSLNDNIHQTRAGYTLKINETEIKLDRSNVLMVDRSFTNEYDDFNKVKLDIGNRSLDVHRFKKTEEGTEFALYFLLPEIEFKIVAYEMKKENVMLENGSLTVHFQNSEQYYDLIRGRSGINIPLFPGDSLEVSVKAIGYQDTMLVLSWLSQGEINLSLIPTLKKGFVKFLFNDTSFSVKLKKGSFERDIVCDGNPVEIQTGSYEVTSNNYRFSITDPQKIRVRWGEITKKIIKRRLATRKVRINIAGELKVGNDSRLPKYVTIVPINVEGVRLKNYPGNTKGETIELRAGDYVCNISDPNFEPFRESFTVTGGESIDTLNIELVRKKINLKLKIIPFDSYEVEVFRSDDSLYATSGTNESGDLNIQKLSVGSYYFKIKKILQNKTSRTKLFTLNPDKEIHELTINMFEYEFPYLYSTVGPLLIQSRAGQRNMSILSNAVIRTGNTTDFGLALNITLNRIFDLYLEGAGTNNSKGTKGLFSEGVGIGVIFKKLSINNLYFSINKKWLNDRSSQLNPVQELPHYSFGLSWNNSYIQSVSELDQFNIELGILRWQSSKSSDVIITPGLTIEQKKLRYSLYLVLETSSQSFASIFRVSYRVSQREMIGLKFEYSSENIVKGIPYPGIRKDFSLSVHTVFGLFNGF